MEMLPIVDWRCVWHGIRSVSGSNSVSLWCGEPPQYQDCDNADNLSGVDKRCYLLGDVVTVGDNPPSVAGEYIEGASVAVRGGPHWLRVCWVYLYLSSWPDQNARTYIHACMHT